MTTFLERFFFPGTVPWKVGEYEHESRGRFRCRPAGRAGTDQKDEYVCTGVRISFFLFLFLTLSVLFLPAEEDTCIYMFSPRDLGICSVHCFMT